MCTVCCLCCLSCSPPLLLLLLLLSTIYYLLSTVAVATSRSLIHVALRSPFSHFSPFLVSFPVSRLIRIVLSRHFSPRFFLLESSTAAASAEPNELARQMDDYKRTSVARWHLLEMGIERTPITTAVYIPLFFPFLLSCFLFVSLVESTNNRLFTYKHV